MNSIITTEHYMSLANERLKSEFDQCFPVMNQTFQQEISGSNFRDCFKLLISRQQKMDQAPSKQYWCYSVTEERHMFYYRSFAKIRI